jgi:ATP-dependent RNA helicase SUPV3L1/SUV3
MQGPREGRRPDGGGGQRQERGRRQFQKGQRGEEARAHDAPRGGKETSNAPAKKEYRPPQVDMDSPFAKLLALKPLLERRDKRT